MAEGLLTGRRLAPVLLEKPCCTDGADDAPTQAGAARVVLVGNPNVGKSTLFNALTGARQHVGNWPGKTVSVARGTWRRPGEADVGVVDLPGTYSLVPDSPDEELTRELLVDAAPGERPDLVVVALDASNLTRNLYLTAQLADTGIPTVVALTMVDVARSRGLDLDTGALADALGVPVVPVVPRSGQGIDELAVVVGRALSAPTPVTPAALGSDLEDAVSAVSAALVAAGPDDPAARWRALALLEGGGDGPDEAVAVARRRAADLLADEAGGDEAGADEARADEAGADEAGADEDAADEVELRVAEARYAWAHDVLGEVVTRRGSRTTWSDRVDRVLTSRWFGLPIFLAVMWGVFEATTTVAAPLQDAVQGLFDGPVSDGFGWVLGVVSAPEWLSGLVQDGLVSGVGQLLSFAPLMAIMFVLLAVLEDSGYMARAAFVVDRLMRVIGLPGKAFLPIIVGFGCNVPALAGTRILRNPRQRLLLGLLIPFVSCSARLTVYVLLAGIFFGDQAGTMVFLMYVLSIVLVVGMGWVLRRVAFRDLADDPLLLELPPYRRPTLRVMGVQTWQKLRAFLRTASGIIVATVTAVWLLSSIPMPGAAAAPSEPASFGHVAPAESVFGGVSRAVAPVFAPAGFDDWHASAALVTGFVAKEAVVATTAQTYSAEEPSDVHQAGALGTALHATFERTSGGHTVAAVLAFMIFLLAYTPCMTTVAAQRAEIGTRATLAGIAMQLLVAWVLAVAVFQVGVLLT
ncbi:ferrous iron transport protein B [Actinomycetospora sp. TBRC 11914]|uniref:ferrous iron transport protein B n=1 Tax=Actinomycetospora sp. TBRC 11914 TaxID=2729387 RepID=UPI00145D1FF0|nr:ferrous iron transport protein B [Actinomycetospora sp. TBRC 11914]NMO92741.1 ferrous iron transport protein B [Actinomycetospora sp. TBRC 11914]